MHACSVHPRVPPAAPNGPSGIFTRDQRHSTPIGVLQELIGRYGDFVHYRTQLASIYLVNHPELVRDVVNSRDCIRNRVLRMVLGDGVLTANGDHWRQERRLMLPDFERRQIEKMVEVFCDVTDERAHSWQTRLRDTSSLDVTADAFRIALTNVGRGLFATDFDDRFLAAVDAIMRELSEIQNASVLGFSLIRKPTTQQSFLDAVQLLDESVQQLMAVFQGRPQPEALLMHTLSGRADNQANSVDASRLMRDEILTMIVAGHETTAVSLCWMLYCVAAHPDVAERLYAEVDRVLGGRRLEAVDLSQLVYTRMIIDETLRLYPPIWIVPRVAARDVEIGGHLIPERSGVLVSPFVLHRHPDFWPDPDTFDPERFAPEAPAPAPHSYIPFYAGRHLCLGKHFALVELVVVLATLAQRFRFGLPHGARVNFDALASLRIRGGLQLTLQPRCPEGMPS